MNKNNFLAVLLGAALAAPAGATPWHTMGPRAMGMGGSFVAMAQGPLASYWNPAGLGQLYNESGLTVPFGLRAMFTGNMIEGANDLNRINEDCQSGGAGSGFCTDSNVSEALGKFAAEASGAQVDAGLGLSFKLKRWVVFVHGLNYVGVTAEPDLVNTSAANLAAGTNNSRLILRGGTFTEIGVGHGRELGETGVILGANAKLIAGNVGYKAFNIFTDEPDSDIFTDFKDNAKASVRPGLDLGLLWDMRETFPSLPMRPRLGLVGRNVNGPKFKQPDAARLAGERDTFTLHGQFRGGVALSPLKWWHLTGDLDLTENLTPIDGFKSRYLSVGTEINLVNHPRFNLPVRAGLQKDVGNNSSLAYTGGVGLNLLHLNIDLSGMISAKRTGFQSEGETEKVPNNAAVSLSVSLLFGAKDEGVRNN